MTNQRRIETLGQFEQLVLAGVQTIENAYAVPVQAYVERVYGREVKFPAIYSALDRLEEKGYIRSRVADPEPRRGNLPKRYYSITPVGERALKQSVETAARLLESVGVPWKPLLGKK